MTQHSEHHGQGSGAEKESDQTTVGTERENRHTQRQASSETLTQHFGHHGQGGAQHQQDAAVHDDFDHGRVPTPGLQSTQVRQTKETHHGCAYEISDAWLRIMRALLLQQNSSQHWTPEQRTEIAQPRADKCPTSHFSPFNSCLSVVLQLEKRGITLKIPMLYHNSVLFSNLLCVWILFWNTSSHSCFRYMYIFTFFFKKHH